MWLNVSVGRRKKKQIATQHIDRNKVLTVRGNPHDDPNLSTFVSTGVNHLRGWCLKGNTLKGHSWTGKAGSLCLVPLCLQSQYPNAFVTALDSFSVSRKQDWKGHAADHPDGVHPVEELCDCRHAEWQHLYLPHDGRSPDARQNHRQGPCWAHFRPVG